MNASTLMTHSAGRRPDPDESSMTTASTVTTPTAGRAPRPSPPDEAVDWDAGEVGDLPRRMFAERHAPPPPTPTIPDAARAARATAASQSKKRSWWDRVVSFRPRRKRSAEDDYDVDQDLYMRTILESYSSSLSSNRYSAPPFKERRSSLGRPSTSSRRAFTDDAGGVYVAQPETPHAATCDLDDDGLRRPPPSMVEDGMAYDDDPDASRVHESMDAVMEDPEERAQRRNQRRITQEAIRAKLYQRNQHRARNRKKLMIFAVCVGLTLTAFITAAILVANTGIKFRKDVSLKRRANATDTTPATTVPPTLSPTLPPPQGSDSGGSVDDVRLRLNNTTLQGRTGLDLITSRPPTSPSNGSSPSSSRAHAKGYWRKKYGGPPPQGFVYVHCLLTSLSLWMSLLVIAMHLTFRTFRTYSLPLVMELSCVQCGYWITSLLRIQTMTHYNESLSYAICLAECFFNFGQISFTCALAFNMYRSVVSYADVLIDTQSAKRRYRTYTINVMLLSLLASVSLALIGYQSRQGYEWESFRPCLSKNCQPILYIYYPLLAFAFNFIFYVRFKRTIGGAYPMSATGRLNKVARSYLITFVICWGSAILLNVWKAFVKYPGQVPEEATFILQSIFDVLGIATAVITMTNFRRCRKAFDFGLSLKAVDHNSIEFESPIQILGEGSFAIVLKARWHQRSVDNSITRTVDVAVKTFKHTQFETLEQMKEEAYLASKLIHPCVMMTYGCYTIGNNLYIVSEYLGGGTLQDLIDTSTYISYEQALRYAHMIAMGMRFLHGLPIPIIHRDLKPLNCIFDSEQEMLKLADFGESRLFRKDGAINQKPGFFPSFDLTLQMTTNIGSACWAAPEVLRDEARTEYSLKVDVYSFGIICWQLYTGKVPYTDIPGSVLAVAEAVIGGRRPEIPSDCPTLFSKIMRRCWHVDPLRRPNFEDIVQLLEMEMTDVRRKEPTMSSPPTNRRVQLVTPTPTAL